VVLGENATSIKENLAWQEATYADELKAYRTLSNLPKEVVIELSALKAALAQKELDLKQQQEHYQQLTEANEKQARENEQLAKENMQLKQALQAPGDKEMALKLERNEAEGAAPPPTTTADKGGEFSRVFSASSSASPLKPATKGSSYAEQVELVSKSVQDKINVYDLEVLLKWVTEGHLEEVEKLLKKNPSLGLGTRTITDLSNRTFNNITVLQFPTRRNPS